MNLIIDMKIKKFSYNIVGMIINYLLGLNDEVLKLD